VHFQTTTPLQPLAMLVGVIGGESGPTCLPIFRRLAASPKDALSPFERYAKGGDDPKLKDCAGKALPALQHHLERARALDKNRK
jgi:hypothetical protein